MKTVFYAWQSDLPNNTNKNFLQECLERAIKKANESRLTPERLVLDKDTQGISGTPDIAKEIFNKISECAVFVSDLSFVTPSNSPRPICNPNVLIELGYAFKAIGDRRLVGLFNTAFGATTELPFDFRNRRFPFDYHLAEDATPEARRSVRDDLVKRLASALADAAKHAPVEAEPLAAKPPHAAAPLDTSTFVPQNSPVIAEVASRTDDGVGGDHVYWHHGPCAWLRVLPSKPLQLLRSRLRTIIEQSADTLEPFGDASNRHSCLNSHGGIVLGFDRDFPETHATRLTQVFRTGEIWGLNKQLLTPRKFSARERSVIPWPEVSTMFEHTLRSYLRFAKESLCLEPSLTIVAGLDMMNEATFVLAKNDDATPERHRCMEQVIRQRWEIETFEVEPRKLFVEWYAALWDACGGLIYSEDEAHVHRWPRY